MVLDDFYARVAEAPDAVAVQDGGLRLTYRDLAAHASDLAADLAGRGVGPDGVVAVYADRSAELVVGKLAALLAGAGYLPLDPAHPVARTRELLALSGAAAVVTTGALTSAGVAPPDRICVVNLAKAPTGVLAARPRPDGARLAYVIYTSGSTGRPKGVAVTHANLANLMRWHQKSYRLGPHDRTTLLVSPGFDVSVWETWPTLATGGTLVVPPAEVRTSPADLAVWLADEQITVTFLPTPLAEAVLDEAWPTHAVLRLMHTGGSAMQRGVPDGLPFAFVNVYGPAECTVSVTTATVVPGGPVPPPIGVPNDGVRCYVLDGLDPVPDGEPGEMVLAGDSVARGYLRDAATTAGVFMPDIVAPGQRMYRTGDKVRRRPDGVFEYLGRLDDQAKIRGFRIEPGEVAAVLRQHPAVRHAFVVAERSGHPDARLVGYVAGEATPAELMEFAGVRLPSYMVPSAIVVLPALPMTPNGKVDRAALPEPDRAAAGLAEVAAAHRTPTETALAAIVARMLGVAQVGADDNFFALGGTSLLVGRLAAEIAAELHATVGIGELFAAASVSAVATIIDRRAAETQRQPAATTAPVAPPLHPARRDRPIPLSLPQERVWFFEQLAPGNLAYNFQATVSLHGEVDTEALRRSLDEIVRRHEILRTAFVTVDGAPVQRPVATAKAPLRVLDVPAEDLEKVIAAEFREPFDLTSPPLARWLLLRHGCGDNTLVHIEHHFVHDGWSLAVLLAELSTLYPAFATGRPSPLPELAVQYADYAVWQRDWMQGEVLKAHVDHWTALLDGAPDILELPADHPRPAVMSMRGAAPRIKIPAELSRALRAFSRQHRVSLFSTMYAGFAALLYRYTGQQDLLVGTGAANRSRPELEPLLGMLVNTLVLRTQISPEQPFSRLLEQVQHTVVATLAWSDTPVDAVIDAIGPTRDPSRTPLFQVMFSFHDSAVPDLDFAGLTGAVTERANGTAKADLNVIVIPRAAQRLGRAARPEDDDLNMIWEYCTDLFDHTTMTRMITHYLNLLSDALTRPSARIDELRLLTDGETDQLDTWSRGPAVADTRPVTELIAEQVRRAPEAIAVSDAEVSLTYGELDQRANRLAAALAGRGVGPESVVAICAGRSAHLVLGQLAVLKTGAAYLPLDPEAPARRISELLTGSGAAALLTTSRLSHDQLPFTGSTLLLDRAGDWSIDGQPVDGQPVVVPVRPESLAYLIYTSGSTGRPKGVQATHGGLANLVGWFRQSHQLGSGDRSTLIASPAFDASVWETWPTLATGGTLVIPPDDVRAIPHDLVGWLAAQQITRTFLPTPLADAVLDETWPPDTALRVLLTGGDALRRATPDGLPFTLVNHYGPTEITVVATDTALPPGGPATPPIGRPVGATRAYVLAGLEPVPIGVPGELCIGGAGVTRGYLDDPAATAAVFVPDPWNPGQRMYRTGDRARWLADGQLEFLGRIDDQVKIRGFRIEPGEIAAALRAHPEVSDAYVVAHPDAARQVRLVGYAASAAAPAELQAFLTERLPSYLVPDHLVVLAALPRNANGKVDRTALPAPEPETRGAATPPHGATEEQLADIWRSLMPTYGPPGSDISRDDSFFALGGNSLLAARLMFRVREVFNVELRMAAFYKAPTLAASAAAIDAARSTARAAVEVPRSTTAPATIGRRDRSAYRVPAQPVAPQRPSSLAPHLVRLTDDWALWRTVCLRAPGFPVHLLETLGDISLAEAADAAIAAAAGGDPAGQEQTGTAYAAEFAAAARRLSAALYEAATLPALREAVAWQNRHALTTGIDRLVGRGPEPGKPKGKSRQHAALVASYLQRYCAKNDTIGFFGPVGWSRIDDQPGIRITHAEPGRWLAARNTYLEGWAVQALMAGYEAALRPWLVPRRMPFVGVDGTMLRLPLAPPVPLTPAEAAVLRACDGVRDASAVAALVLADPTAGLNDVAEVFAVMARLADSHRIAWQVDVAPQDLRSERSMRRLVSRVTDDSVREPAIKAIDELAIARDELAAAGGDSQQVAAAMANLEATFTRLAGAAPTRREGELYAGRTLAYEECLRGDTVQLGTDTLDGIREALALVLHSARWFTTDSAATYARHFDEAHRQRAAALGTDVVPFSDIWLIVNDALFTQPPRLIESTTRALRQRWSAILDLPAGGRRIQLRAADLRERVLSQFPAGRLPWPMAVHHSPDLMIAGADATSGGRVAWVLGEVHPSVITSRYATWLELHDAPDAYRAAMQHDVNRSAVWVAETAEKGGNCTRLSNVLTSSGDFRLVYAHDSCGYDPAMTVVVGDCDVISSPTGLRVRRRDGTFERDLLEVVGDVIMSTISNSFEVVPPGAYTPRVTIDDLVVSRERWTVAATDLAFADTTDESTRYLQARAWAASLGLPRHVFLRFTGEGKPIYADLTSLASVDLMSRSARRARRNAGAAATVTVVEMLPTPDQAWLTDARGQRYTAELRLVAVDQARVTADALPSAEAR
ncbi:MAG: amino acid adenylation domain-containing protein [Micromonosporaceae bacterium]